MSLLAPVIDRNLRLAIVDEVYQARTNDYEWLDRVPELRQRYEEVRLAADGPAWDELGEQPVYVPALEELILALPVTEDDLAGVEDLTLDGDRPVYPAVFNFWWDLGDQFTIRDLTGIEVLANLHTLHLGQGLVEGASLAPLERLPRLRSLALCHSGGHRDVASLGRLPLDTIWLTNLPAQPTEDWALAVASLQSRHVTFR